MRENWDFQPWSLFRDKGERAKQWSSRNYLAEHRLHLTFTSIVCQDRACPHLLPLHILAGAGLRACGPWSPVTEHTVPRARDLAGHRLWGGRRRAQAGVHWLTCRGLGGGGQRSVRDSILCFHFITWNNEQRQHNDNEIQTHSQINDHSWQRWCCIFQKEWDDFLDMTSNNFIPVGKHHLNSIKDKGEQIKLISVSTAEEKRKWQKSSLVTQVLIVFWRLSVSVFKLALCFFLQVSTAELSSAFSAFPPLKFSGRPCKNDIWTDNPAHEETLAVISSIHSCATQMTWINHKMRDAAAFLLSHLPQFCLLHFFPSNISSHTAQVRGKQFHILYKTVMLTSLTGDFDLIIFVLLTQWTLIHGSFVRTFTITSAFRMWKKQKTGFWPSDTIICVLLMSS